MFVEQFEPYQFPLLNWVRLPTVELDTKWLLYAGLPENTSHVDFLSHLIKQGLDKKMPTIPKDRLSEYFERIEKELALIQELGFVDYFLLVWMVINKARELGTFIDYGRGSAGASLIFYLIGVTGIDPIQKNLILERFISRVRANKREMNGVTYVQGDLAPDVDINIGPVRPSVVQWLYQLYQGRIAKIAALSTFTGKILVKDVFKAVDEVNEDEAKRVADTVEKHFGIVEDIEKMPEKSKDFAEWVKKHPETFGIALKLRDVIRQKTSHASGYLISFDALDGNIPIELNKDKEITVSFEMKDAAKIALKLDLLGLTSNGIIKDVLDNIPEKVEDIELDVNPLIYDQFQTGKLLPYGLYQISADCMFRVTAAIKPKNINELSDANAIARPGALSYLADYVNNSSKPVNNAFTDILKPTRFLCLYQEQMMRLLMKVGFSGEDAERCRKIVGKKEVSEVKKWKERVYQSCRANGYDESVGNALWKVLDDSAKYSFNSTHSLSVSYTGALTIYLKYKYPQQFYIACLKATRELAAPIEEISLIQSELSHFGIKLLPPHIIKSGQDFQPEGANIRYPLRAIKGVAEKTLEKLNNFKHEYSSKFDIFQAAEDAGLSISILNALIFSGCLDDASATNRSRLSMEAGLWNILTQKEKEQCFKYGPTYSWDLLDTFRYVREQALNLKGKPVVKPSRYETIKKYFQPYLDIYNLNRKNELLTNYVFENRLLGFSYSCNLRDIFQRFCGDLVTIHDVVNKTAEREAVHFAGEIVEFKEGVSKEKKNAYWKLFVKDGTGQTNILLTNSVGRDNIGDSIENNGRKPAVGDIIICRGSKGADIVFARAIGIQPCEVFDKVSQLKDRGKDLAETGDKEV
jgi:DNA polymerase-3 subunit alpha